MLHIRNNPGDKNHNAYTDTLILLKEHAKVKGDVHFFAGNLDEAKAFLDFGFTLSFTDDNISYFDGTGSARADWGNLKFVNSAKKSVFEIYSSVKYSSKNVKSISDTISAVIPNGGSEGQQEKLWTGGYTGTYYVYEWKQIP